MSHKRRNEQVEWRVYKMQWAIEAAKFAAIKQVERSRAPQTSRGVDSIQFLSMAQFNLGIAIELAMKSVMTSVEGSTWDKFDHSLVGLYDDLSERGYDLDTCFSTAWAEAGVALSEVAFSETDSPVRPDPPGLDDRKPDDLRSLLERFDKVMKLWEKRYDFIDGGGPSYFIGPESFPVWYHFVNRVCDLAQSPRSSGGTQ